MSGIAIDKQSEIIDQKRQSWGQMGVVVYKQELQLQAEAQAIIHTIAHPKTIEDVPAAELKLKEVKAAQKTIEGKRKEITGRFDDVVSRLMQPEKSFADPITKLSTSIIDIKKTYEAEQKKRQLVIDEAQRLRLYYSNESARVKSELLQKVNTLVSRCYEKALQDENVKPVNIEQYINVSKEAVKGQHFAFTITKFGITYEDNIQLNTDLFNEAMNIDLEYYSGEFKRQIDYKFSDYEVAYSNKALALAAAKKEEEENKKAIEEKKKSEELAAKLEATATPVHAAPLFTKALKKSYEVDMPETVESVLNIMAAFSANINKCLPKLKVNKWFAFTPGQAANVLGKLKSEDNSFHPDSITFKEVDKL